MGWGIDQPKGQMPNYVHGFKEAVIQKIKPIHLGTWNGLWRKGPGWPFVADLD